MRNPIKVILLFYMGISLSACGSPESIFRDIVNDKGYIAYPAPMSAVGVGTILSGKPDALRVSAPPQRCFPDVVDNQPTELRYVVDTTLPNTYKSFQIGFGIDLADLLMAGNPLLDLNLGFGYAKNVAVEFEGATVETVDEVALSYHYNFLMSQKCKDYVTKFPFIVQALRIEKMKFQFYDKKGVAINLGIAGSIDNLVNMGPGVSFHIENRYTLVVDSPKYIGYQVGVVGDEGENSGIIAYHANEVKKGEYDFQEVRGINDRVGNQKLMMAKPAAPVGTVKSGVMGFPL